MKVAIDIDGVIASFVPRMYEHINKIYPGRLPLGYVQSDWACTEKMTSDEMAICLKSLFEYSSHLWIGLDSLPGLLHLRERMRDLQVAQVDIYYLTHRSNPLKGDTALVQTTRWLDKAGVLYDNASLIVVENRLDKIEFIKRLKIDMSIDDNGDTVQQLMFLPGHQPFVLDAPWNREQKYRYLSRVDSVREFLSKVLDKSIPAKLY